MTNFAYPGSGSVACLFTDDTPAALDWLREQASLRDDLRLVAWRCRKLLPLRDLVNAILLRLGEASLMVWPDWPTSPPAPPEPQTAPSRMEGGGEESRPEAPSQPLPAWRRAAAGACQRQRPPILNGFSPAIQARQLALTLCESHLAIALVLEDPQPHEADVLVLARALEWLARESNAGVIAVLPESLADHAALDAVNFVSAHWTSSRPANPIAADGAPHAWEERKHVLCPVIGRPHPGSPGEQLLAARLASDGELAGEFEFNQRVSTLCDNRFLVDLLCRTCRLVVEVDGYGHHAHRSAFNADRQRDYELLISGYQVLRLPHDFVVQDVELAVVRIREVYRFRRRSLGQEAPR
jgi:very-short-patch-repair endonuclease